MKEGSAFISRGVVTCCSSGQSGYFVYFLWHDYFKEYMEVMEGHMAWNKKEKIDIKILKEMYIISI